MSFQSLDAYIHIFYMLRMNNKSNRKRCMRWRHSVIGGHHTDSGKQAD